MAPVMEDLVAFGEAFYAQRKACPLFLVSNGSAPPGLAAHLASRGYHPEARTLVMTAWTAEVAQRARAGGWHVTVAETADDDWFNAYWSVEGLRDRSTEDGLVCRTVLLASALPQRFASAHLDGTVVATGQAVLEQGWAGLQCMATRPAHRGQGAASAVLVALADGVDTERMYLAVQADNRPAIALYERCGFSFVHDYEYWARR